MTEHPEPKQFAAAVASIARSPREQQIIDRAQAVMVAATQTYSALIRSGGKWSTTACEADLALINACIDHFESDAPLAEIADTRAGDIGPFAEEAFATPCLSTEPPCAALHGSAVHG